MVDNKVKVQVNQGEVLINKRKIKFDSSKAKELFLLLITDEREYLEYKEIFDCLWTKNGFKHYDASACRRAVFNMQRILEGEGMGNIINVDIGGCGINKENLDYRIY